MPRERVLKLYGWLFAAAGAAFVLAPGLVAGAIDALASSLPGSLPVAQSVRTYWLALTGSMTAVIALMALRLSRDPEQPAAWDALLLSKGVSTALFAAFAAAERNTAFLLGAAVDGAIFAHLALLRAPSDPDPLSARLGGGRGHEVWFAEFNDPASGDALWVRYTTTRRPEGAEASCWAVLFDRGRREIHRARWTQPLASAVLGPGPEPFRLGGSRLARGRLVGENPGARWDLAWREEGAPLFRFVPRLLSILGLAGSQYVSLGLARFDGEAEIGGRRCLFKRAAGTLGHLWGSRMAPAWRWAHAVFEGEEGPPAVFEILSAPVRLGPLGTHWLTAAHLWFGGRHLVSGALSGAVWSRSRREGAVWSFRVRCGELEVRGECAQDPGLTAELDYEGPRGERVRCRNSKTGRMRLELRGPDGGRLAELFTPGAAAVEFAEGVP